MTYGQMVIADMELWSIRLTRRYHIRPAVVRWMVFLAARRLKRLLRAS